MLVLTVGRVGTGNGLATAAGTLGEDAPVSVTGTGGIGTAKVWPGIAPVGATVLGCRCATAYRVDAGAGVPLPGLIPGA